MYSICWLNEKVQFKATTPVMAC